MDPGKPLYHQPLNSLQDNTPLAELPPFSTIKIHNQKATRALMAQLFDPQMCNIADFDCFSQVVFQSVEDYKRMKQDPWYKEHLVGDHENFADTKKST